VSSNLIALQSLGVFRLTWELLTGDAHSRPDSTRLHLAQQFVTFTANFLRVSNFVSLVNLFFFHLFRPDTRTQEKFKSGRRSQAQKSQNIVTTTNRRRALSSNARLSRAGCGRSKGKTLARSCLAVAWVDSAGPCCLGSAAAINAWTALRRPLYRFPYCQNQGAKLICFLLLYCSLRVAYLSVTCKSACYALPIDCTALCDFLRLAAGPPSRNPCGCSKSPFAVEKRVWSSRDARFPHFTFSKIYLKCRPRAHLRSLSGSSG
jgi:hypothetical protein